MKKLLFVTFILTILGSLSVSANTNDQQKKISLKGSSSAIQDTQLKQDEFSLKGTFRWTFYSGPFEQNSTHIFSDKFIDYQMRGKIHSTDYRMALVSYDDKEKKWIGKTPEGVVYVIFFKNVTDNKLTIYKHKCKQGLAEALNFKRPAADATEDHGWNTYKRKDV